MMKLWLSVVVLGFGTLVNAASYTIVGNNCTNHACDWCESLSAACIRESGTGTQNLACLCTRQFEVNVQRCQTGIACPWNGETELPHCRQDCPGVFEQSFLDQCSGGFQEVPITSPSPIVTSTVPATNTVPELSSGTGTVAQPPSTTGTVTRLPAGTTTGTGVITGYASTVQIPIGMAAILGMSSVLLW